MNASSWVDAHLGSFEKIREEGCNRHHTLINLFRFGGKLVWGMPGETCLGKLVWGMPKLKREIEMQSNLEALLRASVLRFGCAPVRAGAPVGW